MIKRGVSAEVAFQEIEIADHILERIDEFLSKGWSSYERRTGRCFDVKKLDGEDAGAVIKFYSKPELNWSVEYCSDQRDGDFLRFIPKGGCR